jgi:hypothetical protein
VPVKVLLSKLISVGASPTVGFTGPISLELSATETNTLELMLVLSIAVNSEPVKVIVAGCAVRLESEMTGALVSTVLPFSSISGAGDELANDDPSTTVKNPPAVEIFPAKSFSKG